MRALDDAYEHVFEMVGRGGYDIVHSHGFDPPALQRARAVARRVIHTVHLPPEPEAAAALREARAASEPAIVVGVSVAQARASSPFIAFDRVSARVPVDPHPVSDHRATGSIFAGRLSAEKGPPSPSRSRGCPGERIDLYGAAYDEDYARDLRRRHGGDPAVAFHEPLSRTELWPQARFGPGCPVSERRDEPFGLVAAEAQAAGTPVVAFARGGLTEIIDDTVTGFLVEPGNVAEAVAAVRSVARLDRRRCRQHAVDDLDLEACLSGYEALYASVAGRVRDWRSREQRIGGHPVDLPKHPVVDGHPIHAILSDGPVVLIPLAIVAEAWSRKEAGNGIRLGDVVTAGAAVPRWRPASSAGSTG